MHIDLYFKTVADLDAKWCELNFIIFLLGHLMWIEYLYFVSEKSKDVYDLKKCTITFTSYFLPVICITYLFLFVLSIFYYYYYFFIFCQSYSYGQISKQNAINHSIFFHYYPYLSCNMISMLRAPRTRYVPPPPSPLRSKSGPWY